MLLKIGGVCVDVVMHYDLLIEENHDSVHDSALLKEYMNKWDGRVFMDALQLSLDKSVLEIGVGTGRLAVQTSPLCGTFCGIDISPKTIRRAKENLYRQHNVNLICGDFMTYHFGNTFDIVYSSLTFMHIKQKQQAIAKVEKLLNHAGRFILSIDKNQSRYIEYGDRKIEVYPDSPDKMINSIQHANLIFEEQIETEFAYILTANKP